MRKSTVVFLSILVFAAIATTWAFKLYTDQVVEEIRHAKDLSDEFHGALLPKTKIRLRRVNGAKEYVVTDPATATVVFPVATAPPAAIVYSSPSRRDLISNPATCKFVLSRYAFVTLSNPV